MFRPAPCSSSGGQIVSSGIVTLEIDERTFINKMRSAVLLKQYAYILLKNKGIVR